MIGACLPLYMSGVFDGLLVAFTICGLLWVLAKYIKSAQQKEN